MEIDNVHCFLCHDTPDVLYKLCECLESNCNKPITIKTEDQCAQCDDLDWLNLTASPFCGRSEEEV